MEQTPETYQRMNPSLVRHFRRESCGHDVTASQLQARAGSQCMFVSIVRVTYAHACVCVCVYIYMYYMHVYIYTRMHICI